MSILLNSFKIKEFYCLVCKWETNAHFSWTIAYSFSLIETTPRVLVSYWTAVSYLKREGAKKTKKFLSSSSSFSLILFTLSLSLSLSLTVQYTLEKPNPMACEAEDESPRFFVAVHVGAGYHAPSNEKSLRSAMKRACLAASSILRKVSLSLSPFASLESFQKLGVSFFYNIYIYIYMLFLTCFALFLV